MDAYEYADKVNSSPAPKPCKYGHRDCSLVDGGMCSDEMLSKAEAREARAAAEASSIVLRSL